MSNELVKQNNASILEQVVIKGDLAQLKPEERVAYYKAVCESVGLNPLTQPFQYITLNGKLTLYARKDATDQLREIKSVSINKLERERIEDIYTVTAYASNGASRTDSSIGAVSIAGLRGDALANAIMKAETKAKRRVTLSICGLGMLDETELETIHDATPAKITVVETHGEIGEQPAHTEPVSHNTPEPQQRTSSRPYTPDGVVAGIMHFVDLYTEKPNDKYKETWRTGIASNIEKEVSEYANNKQEVRQAILQYLVGKEHVDQLTVPEVSAIWRWLGVNKRDENGNVVKEGGAWSLDPNTEKEIKAIYDKLNGSGEENIVDAEVDERGDAPD